VASHNYTLTYTSEFAIFCCSCGATASSDNKYSVEMKAATHAPGARLQKRDYRHSRARGWMNR